MLGFNNFPTETTTKKIRLHQVGNFLTS